MSTVTAPTVDQLRTVTTVSVQKAGAWLGMSTASSYRAASDGSLPTILVGKTLRVPTPRLLALVGLPYEVESEPFSGGAPGGMSAKENPEEGNLGAEDDDAGSEIDVSMLPAEFLHEPLCPAITAKLVKACRRCAR